MSIAHSMTARDPSESPVSLSLSLSQPSEHDRRGAHFNSLGLARLCLRARIIRDKLSKPDRSSEIKRQPLKSTLPSSSSPCFTCKHFN